MMEKFRSRLMLGGCLRRSALRSPSSAIRPPTSDLRPGRIRIMIRQYFLTAAAVCALAWSASAQSITYVDATDGASGNTRLTNGATWSPQTANQGTTGDGLWARRAFGNGATI